MLLFNNTPILNDPDFHEVNSLTIHTIRKLGFTVQCFVWLHHSWLTGVTADLCLLKKYVPPAMQSDRNTQLV